MAPSISTLAKLAFLSLGAVIGAAAGSTPSSSLATLSHTAGNCTSTISTLPKMTAGPTQTLWTTTVTATLSLDCGNCSHVHAVRFAVGVPPAVFFSETVTATGASTTTEFACRTAANTSASPSPSVAAAAASYEMPAMPARPSTSGCEKKTGAVAAVPSRKGEPNHKVSGPERITHLPSPTLTSSPPAISSLYPHQGNPNHKPEMGEPQHQKRGPGITATITAPGITSPTCTTSFALAPPRARSILTIHPSTVTVTSRVYCGSCALVWSTREVAGQGAAASAPVSYVATKTTKKPATETHLKCYKFKMRSTKTKKTKKGKPTVTVTATATATTTMLSTVVGEPTMAQPTVEEKEKASTKEQDKHEEEGGEEEEETEDDYHEDEDEDEDE